MLNIGTLYPLHKHTHTHKGLPYFMVLREAAQGRAAEHAWICCGRIWLIVTLDSDSQATEMHLPQREKVLLKPQHNLCALNMTACGQIRLKKNHIFCSFFVIHILKHILNTNLDTFNKQSGPSSIVHFYSTKLQRISIWKISKWPSRLLFCEAKAVRCLSKLYQYDRR